MIEIVDFVKARLDEEEHDARFYIKHGQSAGGLEWAQHALRRIEADRRIIALWERDDAQRHVHAEGEARAWRMDDVIAALALPHADHPEYREDWRPS